MQIRVSKSEKGGERGRKRKSERGIKVCLRGRQDEREETQDTDVKKWALEKDGEYSKTEPNHEQLSNHDA